MKSVFTFQFYIDNEPLQLRTQNTKVHRMHVETVYYTFPVLFQC
jgi:hypothetical protein